MFFSNPALAVAPEDTPKAPRASGDVYGTKVKLLAKTYAKGRRPVLSHAVFSKLDWVERTALMNVVCVEEPRARCEQALALGLGDNSLLVRDHAFRLLLLDTGSDTTAREDVLLKRRRAARKVLEDDRNYRRGQGLWIVERARKYLEWDENEGSRSRR